VDTSIRIRPDSGGRNSATDFGKVRLLVLGDSGAGKTSLVHQLCYRSVLTNPRWTVGCKCDVLLHESKRRNKPCFVEFFDVGGHRNHAISRRTFFSQINGIMIVFDMSNRNSYNNIREWIKEIVRVDKMSRVEEDFVLPHTNTYGGATAASNVMPLSSLPVIVVGTKLDVLDPSQPRAYECMKDYGLDYVSVSGHHNADDTLAHLSDFFDRVIERRHFGSTERANQRLSQGPTRTPSSPAYTGDGTRKARARHPADTTPRNGVFSSWLTPPSKSKLIKEAGEHLA